MPRGVKGSGTPRKPRAVPGQAQAQDGPKGAARAAAHPSNAADVVADTGPLGSVDVDSLSGDSLKRYARRAGVMQRDVDNLTEDRLRQNVKVLINEHFELLTEA